MCRGYDCTSSGAPKTEQAEQAEDAPPKDSRFQSRRGKRCWTVDRHLLHPRKSVVVDDGRCSESVAVLVRNDDGVFAGVAVAHPMSGLPGRFWHCGTSRKILPDTRPCPLRHRGCAGVALFP